ncbi:hypothetical protein TRM7557_02524 [Tritonibacter multivorans]|uniref:DUF2157 domain-containing protein n=1 Tax=Tritonibacter multivorans TaxID=928856 RepID=A0A0P1GE24_9RHOB|nr:hypothetical protein [Tritonibacter multivorans]MDA7420102.1 hypothetical protein [Tritonibacter multivorans]CUH79691.1 hypothetical protein TRM7557_02524 [Tritonibacter multivorans]SFC04481.1 hypothetical protein SAMN04488049_101194 [Tritonibacter multivorans]
MISADDLRAAVGSGLLSEAQAASLKALSDSRRGAREDLAPGDEPFELFKGFNEIFIVIGLIILCSGWITMNSVALAADFGNYKTHLMGAAGIGAVFLWGVSEYFIRHRRMVGPAIALSIMFAGNALAGFAAWRAQPFMIAQNDYSSLPIALGLSIVALAIYWIRFRVPFTMALMALGLFAVALIIGADRAGVPSGFADLFRLSAQGPFAWITLAVGLAVFAMAMAFDLSDPHRVTRRSAQGFWLHVVAAPALVNTIALSLMERSQDTLLVVVLLFFALVAIVIDRRSFLITAIGYIVALASTVFDGESAGLFVLGLGLFLVALGAFWARIRAALLSLLSGVLPLHRLPPSHQ